MTRVLRGRCGGCGHVWVVAYLPMDVVSLAKLARGAACPMCAGSKVFVATATAPLDPETPGKITREHE